MNPLAERLEAKLKAVTLDAVFTEYLAARKDLKPKTVYTYQRVLNISFSDWRAKPLLAITKDMVARQHAMLGELGALPTPTCPCVCFVPFSTLRLASTKIRPDVQW